MVWNEYNWTESLNAIINYDKYGAEVEGTRAPKNPWYDQIPGQAATERNKNGRKELFYWYHRFQINYFANIPLPWQLKGEGKRKGQAKKGVKLTEKEILE